MDSNIGYPNFHTVETLDSIQSWAQTQPRNREYFLEIQRHPAAGAWIKIDREGKLHVTITNVDKFVNYPQDVTKLGFRWYIQEIMRAPNAAPGVTKKVFTQALDRCIDYVNNAIQKDHGIECLLLGSESANDDRTRVILHFCDVLVVKMRQRAGLDPPNVIIKSSQLQTISTSFAESFFQDLPSEDMYFMFMNADLFYHIYGLWGNYSHKPIRLENKDIVGLTRSENFTSDLFYKKHQLGKYNAMERKAHSEECKLYYMVD